MPLDTGTAVRGTAKFWTPSSPKMDFLANLLMQFYADMSPDPVYGVSYRKQSHTRLRKIGLKISGVWLSATVTFPQHYQFGSVRSGWGPQSSKVSCGMSLYS